MTDDIFDAAAAWISNAPEPWFAYVAPFAAHKPFHCPPGTSPDPYNGHVFPCTNQPEPSTLVKYRSMIEALDLDFLDILNAVKARDISATRW